MRKHLIGLLILLGVVFASLLAGSVINAFFDLVQVASVPAPASGNSRISVSSSTHKMICTNSDSSSCLASGGGGGTYAGFSVQSGSNFYGPLFPFTIPTDPGTWINQAGSAITTNADGTLTFSFPAGSGFAQHARIKAIPSTPYTVTVLILQNLAVFNTASSSALTGCGLTLAASNSSASANIYFIEYLQPGSAAPYQYTLTKWNDYLGSFSSNYQAGLVSPGQGKTWFRIGDDGTTRTYALSNDGVTFRTVQTTTTSDFITPAFIGYTGEDGTENSAYGCTVLSSTL